MTTVPHAFSPSQPAPPGASAPLPTGLDRLVSLAAAAPLQPRCAQFYFLRHGQTPRNALRIFQSYDEPLSALGEQQAAAAAQVLAHAPIQHIICSDARRALHTAQVVATALQRTPEPRSNLRERHFGALVGSSSAHIDWDCAPEGGETLPAFVSRTRAAMDEALAHPNEPVLVVAHGGTLYVLAALLGVPVHPNILANAHPLHFCRHGEGANARWQAQSLSPVSPTDVAGALA